MSRIFKWTNEKTDSPCPSGDHEHVFHFTTENVHDRPLAESENKKSVEIEDDGFGNAWTVKIVGAEFSENSGEEYVDIDYETFQNGDGTDFNFDFVIEMASINTVTESICFQPEVTLYDQEYGAPKYLKTEFHKTEVWETKELTPITYPGDDIWYGFSFNHHIDISFRVTVKGRFPNTCIRSHLGNIGISMLKFLSDRMLCDMTIECQGSSFPCHKIVLASQSEVFCAMFTHDTKESKNAKVNIKDAHPDTIKNMIDFFYQGKLTENSVDFEDLLLLADKYQMTTLRKYCLSQIGSSMTPDNSNRLSKLANQIQDNDLAGMVENLYDPRALE